MPCEPFALPGGGRGIICTRVGLRPRRCGCGSGLSASLLCDWKTPTPRNARKTCDAAICSACSHVPAPGKDLCPRHAGEWLEILRARADRRQAPSP